MIYSIDYIEPRNDLGVGKTGKKGVVDISAEGEIAEKSRIEVALSHTEQQMSRKPFHSATRRDPLSLGP